jgi:hypothetical protein
MVASDMRMGGRKMPLISEIWTSDVSNKYKDLLRNIITRTV